MTDEELDSLQALAEEMARPAWEREDRANTRNFRAAGAGLEALLAEVRRLRQQIEGHAASIAAQSELLSQRAEK